MAQVGRRRSPEFKQGRKAGSRREGGERDVSNLPFQGSTTHTFIFVYHILIVIYDVS
jgi:hypothetical protein